MKKYFPPKIYDTPIKKDSSVFSFFIRQHGFNLILCSVNRTPSWRYIKSWVGSPRKSSSCGSLLWAATCLESMMCRTSAWNRICSNLLRWLFEWEFYCSFRILEILCDFQYWISAVPNRFLQWCHKKPVIWELPVNVIVMFLCDQPQGRGSVNFTTPPLNGVNTRVIMCRIKIRF